MLVSHLMNYGMKNMKNLISEKFNPVCPYTGEIDFYTTKTVVAQKPGAVRFEDGTAARVVENTIVNHNPA